MPRHRTPGRPDAVWRWLLAFDIGAASLAWGLGLAIAGHGHGEIGLVAGTVLTAVAVAVAVETLAAQDMYRSWTHLVGPVGLTRTFRAVLFAVIAVLVAAQLIGVAVSPTRAVVGGLWMLAALSAGRWVVLVWVHRRRRQGRFVARTLLVGADDAAFVLWRHVASRPDSGREIVGYVSDRGVGAERAWNIPWLGAATDAISVARQRGLDGIVIAHGAVSSDDLNLVVRGAHACGLDVELIGGLSHIHHRRLVAAEVAHEPVVFIEPRRSGRVRAVVKRLVDLIVGGVVLLAVSPLFVGVIVVIAVCDGRPIFYRQVRIGQHQRPFRLWKFRTMERDADQLDQVLQHANERHSGPLFKLDSDPRVTRVGRLLRAMSIDELPQLFNVLAGQMSLVGPRPALPTEVACFDASLQERSQVKPGITGLWQIEARDNPDFYAYRQLDLFYAENWSLSLDAAIVLYTIPCLIRHAFSERRKRNGSIGNVAEERVGLAGDRANGTDFGLAGSVVESAFVPSGASSLAGIEPR